MQLNYNPLQVDSKCDQNVYQCMDQVNTQQPFQAVVVFYHCVYWSFLMFESLLNFFQIGFVDCVAPNLVQYLHTSIELDSIVGHFCFQSVCQM